MRVILVAAVVVGMLVGCAPRDAEPTPPPVAETPIETPAPEPTKPPLSELYLHPDGLGPLVVGEAPPVTDPEVDVAIFDEDYCAQEVADGAISDPGKWVANYPVDGAEFPQLPFAVQVTDGVLTALFTQNPAIHTENGVGVGSNLDALLAEHPDAVRVSKDFIDLYVITGSTGQLVFEVGKANSIGYDPDIIALAHVIPIDVEPYSFANSDAGFGGCVSA